MLDKLKEENLRGFIVWLPMMQTDGEEQAGAEAENLEGLNVMNFWDREKRIGDLLAGRFGISSTAWDVYMLFGPGATWRDDKVPEPAFWMHQLPASIGADPSRMLYPTRFIEKLSDFLNTGSRYDDLGFEIHAGALAGLARQKDRHDMDDIRRAFGKFEAR